MNKHTLISALSLVFVLSSCTSRVAVVGEIGPIGPKGDTGLTGPTGIQGLPGVSGQPGETGLTGAQGPRGFSGSGSTGATGATGATGPAGTSGEAYVEYPNISNVDSNYINNLLVENHGYFVINSLSKYLEFATYSGVGDNDTAKYNDALEFYGGKFILTVDIDLDYDLISSSLKTTYAITQPDQLMIGKKAFDYFLGKTTNTTPGNIGGLFVARNFNGIFDGAGKTISNLDVSGAIDASLFYYNNYLGISSEDQDNIITVKNLNLTGFNLESESTITFDINDDESTVNYSAGALFSVLVAKRVILSNISLSNSIISARIYRAEGDTESETYSSNNAGGLFGFAQSQSFIADNINISETVSVTADGTAGGIGGGVVGGIESGIYNGMVSSFASIVNSQNKGFIESNFSAAGGLFGLTFVSNLIVKNSANLGLISSDYSIIYNNGNNPFSFEYGTGGIIGTAIVFNLALFDGVYNAGAVFSDYIAGGIIGAVWTGETINFMYQEAISDAEIKILNSYSSGLVGSSAYVGGLVGYVYTDDGGVGSYPGGTPTDLEIAEYDVRRITAQMQKLTLNIDNTFVAGDIISYMGVEVGGFIGGFGINEPIVYTDIEVRINNSFVYSLIDIDYEESNSIIGSDFNYFINFKVKPINVYYNLSQEATFDDSFGSLPLFDDKYFKQSNFIFKDSWDFANTWKFDASLNGGLPTLINNPHQNIVFVL